MNEKTKVLPIKKGDRGEAVRNVQKYLRVTESGNFDRMTETAVRAWQSSVGLVPTGVIDVPSWSQMSAASFGADPPGTVTLGEVTIQPYPTIKLGSKGETVAKWQRMIGVKADGNFGPLTDDATKKWQGDHGLKADGVVGIASWAEALKNTSPTGMLALEWNQASEEIPSPPAPPSVIAPVVGAMPLGPSPIQGYAIPPKPAAVKAPPLMQSGMMGAFDNLSTPVKLGIGAAVVAAIIASAPKKKGAH